MHILKLITPGRREALILAAMLESLHLCIWVDFGSALSRSFLLIHLGLFLIWQPVWRGDEKLAWHNGVMFLVMTLAFVTWLNWWLLFGWLLLLTGFCGGRVTVERRGRVMHMLVLLFLISELMIPCTSALFGVAVSGGAVDMFGTMLPVLPLLLVIFPYSTQDRSVRSVDFLHAIAAAMLVSLLIVGSLLTMYRSSVDYLVALVQTLIAIGAFLFAISWLLTPRAGFSGLSQLWLGSLLNIGTPFEQWLSKLSSLFRQNNSPEEFLEQSIRELAALDWVAGVRWQSARSEGFVRMASAYESMFSVDDLKVTVFSNGPIGGALYLHCKLLVQLVGNFYVAKLRERELTKQTHLQAIYETGARVTHDIKNLLQSLQAITSIIIHESDSGNTSVSQKLLKRQLPHFTQRLQLALDKLQTPETTQYESIYLKDWWHDLRQRYNQPNLQYQAEIEGDPVIPADLFDSVVENLLENIREKTQIETDVAVTVSVFCDARYLHLYVCDSGSEIPDEKAKLLFREPLQSDSGLGIGLYQAARQAESMGYSLKLAHNQDGRVCFELANDVADITRENFIVHSV